MSVAEHSVLVTITEKPEISEPEFETGEFVRIIFNNAGTAENPQPHWDVDARRKGSGWVENYSFGPKVCHLSSVIDFLANWPAPSYVLKHIYINEEAAKLLLPEMCAPKLALRLAEPHPGLYRLCTRVIRSYLEVFTQKRK